MTLNALLWGLVLYTIPGLFYVKGLFARKEAKEVLEDAKPDGPVYLFVLWMVTVLVWAPLLVCSLWGFFKLWRKCRSRIAETNAFGQRIKDLAASIERLNQSVTDFKKAVEGGDEAAKRPVLEALLLARLVFADQLCKMVDYRCSDCGGVLIGTLIRLEPVVLCRICGRMSGYEEIQTMIDRKLQGMKEALK